MNSKIILNSTIASRKPQFKRIRDINQSIIVFEKSETPSPLPQWFGSRYSLSWIFELGCFACIGKLLHIFYWIKSGKEFNMPAKWVDIPKVGRQNSYTYFENRLTEDKQTTNSLTLCPLIFFFFHEMIALQRLWKMLFISSKKLFSFSKYSNFRISILHFFFSLWAIAL